MDDTPTDTVAPWTIKSVSTATREAVIVAARKEGLTVGQWLEKRVGEWLEDGGPVVVGPGQAGSSRALTVVNPNGAGSDVDALKALVEMARSLSDQPDDAL